WAVTLAQQFGATIHFFILNQNDEYNHNKIRADFNQIKKILEKNNISFTEKTSNPKNGSFVKQTISYAKELNSELIMLSTDPEKITWSLFGSSDEHIIYNTAKIPTLCINVRDLKIILGGL
ncbi:MAG: universal stress protein, partial [Bacteroidales bacterium]|nr:universal stress protein [Bacteroidales bacterium]